MKKIEGRPFGILIICLLIVLYWLLSFYNDIEIICGKKLYVLALEKMYTIKSNILI